MVKTFRRFQISCVGSILAYAVVDGSGGTTASDLKIWAKSCGIRVLGFSIQRKTAGFRLLGFGPWRSVMQAQIQDLGASGGRFRGEGLGASLYGRQYFITH